MFQALGETETGGTDYLSNFRRGKIDKHKVRDIHLWLAQKHFYVARQISFDLFPYKPTDPFQDFIDRHAVMGELRVIRLKEAMGLIERSGVRHERVETLRLSEKFCFELESAINGVALAFQSYQNQWYPLPLGADQRRYNADVEQETNLLPQTTSGKPIPLEENDDAGNHQFVVIVSSDTKLPDDMDSLAIMQPANHQLEVSIVHVKFVA